MPKTVLTDAWLRSNTRRPRNDVLTMSDLVSQNLTVQIARSGRSNFLWRGRSGGKTQTIKLGTYPAYSLADARSWADATTVARDKGERIAPKPRPAVQSDLEAASDGPAAGTVCACFDVYMRFDGGRGKDGGKEKRSKFERLVMPVIGDRQIADVTADDLGAIIANFMEKYPNGGGANRLHAAIARMWRWLAFHPIGRQASGLKTNVFAGAFKPSTEKSRTSFLGNQTIRYLYQALELEPENWRAFYKLLLLTGARRSEISQLRKTNVLIERGIPYILLRLEDAKNDQHHIIPLSPAAGAQLEIARQLSGGSLYFFPAGGDAISENPISGFTHRHNRIVDNMQAISQAENTGALPYWTLHDFRRTMRTFMSKVSVQKHIAEAIISHSGGKSRLDATYDLYEYFDEKTDALTEWGDWVNAITIDRERYLHPVIA